MSEKRVKFIDYNGCYPCLCHGVPNKYKEYSEEINDCMNDNVPWGCCGGCL